MKMFQFAMTALFLMATLPVTTGYAQEMRSLNRIATSRSLMKEVPKGSSMVQQPTPIGREVIQTALEKIEKAWNTPAFDQLVSEQFNDKERLKDAMETEIPADAVLRIQSVRSISTLTQVIAPSPDGGKQRISTVVVILETRTEFNDPVNGFISVPGINEATLEVIEPLKQETAR